MEYELKTHEPLVSIINNDEELIIQFADGQKIITAGIVADLGKEYFIQRTEAFVKINYADFYAGYQKTVETRYLYNIQNEVLTTHFGNLI